jgi:FkbM family methyltransferase
MLKQLLKKALRSAGYVLSSYDFRYDPWAVRMKFLNSLKINLLFDIGANEGQYAVQVRSLGYKGRIVSFEPLSEAYARLKERCAIGLNWEAVNCAIGSFDGTSEINISRNSWSSSLLEMLPAHIESVRDSEYTGTERINVRKIDSLIEDFYRPDEKLFLKIDTQGYGMKVLQGAEKTFERILGIELEMSLVPLYKNEPLLSELVAYLQTKGYTLVYIEPEFFKPETAQLLQVNGLFLRNGAVI